MWQWKDDDGKWNDFLKNDSKMLEGRYSEANGPKLKFATTDFSFNKKHKTVYKIDFSAMTQTNTETGVARAIRRPLAGKQKKAKYQRWSWQDDDEEWHLFKVADARLLEMKYLSKGPKSTMTTTMFSFAKEYKTKYKIDFGKMIQINTDSKNRRPIIRGAPGESVKKKKTKSNSWQWWHAEMKRWESYAPDDRKLLDSAFNCESHIFMTRDFTFNKGYDSLYIIDFKVMAQVNSDSGTSRKIRRSSAGGNAVPEEPAEDKGYADALVGITSGKAYVGSADGPTAPKFKPTIPSKIVAKQNALGSQSKRGGQDINYGPAVSKDEHANWCFNKMLDNEEEFAGEWTVFYHSYSSAALLYEVQAAVAAVLFRFKSQFASLPRLLWKPFGHIPNAARMLEEWPTWPDRDHNPSFRGVGLCATSSLLADDSEAPPKSVFLMGYSVGSVSGILDRLLKSCGVPTHKVKSLAAKIVTLSKKHGLDGCAHGFSPCKSGRAGHLLQIFIRRELCDRYVYPAFPYGKPDKSRDKPLSKYLQRNVKIKGQVRITANPDIFLRATCVRMFVFSADPSFHAKRRDFQEELTDALNPILKDAKVRTKAAKGIFGGKLPAWWSAEDQGDAAKMSFSRYGQSDLTFGS